MTTMPDHVAAYARARPDVRIEYHDETKDCLCRWFMYGPERHGFGPVPDRDSDAFLADVLKGLLAKGYAMEIAPDGTTIYPNGVGDFYPVTGTGPTLATALIAAVLKMGEQG